LRSLDIPALLASLYALVSLLPVEPFTPALIALVGLLMIPGLYVGRWRQPAAYRRAWNVASCAFIFLMLGVRFFLATPSSVVLIFICLFLLLHKWFNERGLREYLEIWALSALVLMVGAMRGEGFFGLLVVCGWGIASMQILNLMAVLRSQSRLNAKTTSPYRVAGHSMRIIWMLLPLTLLVAAGFFTVAPRTRLAAYDEEPMKGLTPVERHVVQTGYSDDVNLRGLTAIKQTEGTAFRVMDAPVNMAGGATRFRVGVLDDFDGWDWSRAHREPAAWVESGKLPYWFGKVADDRSDLVPESGEGRHDLIRIRLVDYPNRSLPLPEAAISVVSLSPASGLEVGSGGRISVSEAPPPRQFEVMARPPKRQGASLPLLGGPVLRSHLEVPGSLQEAVAAASAVAVSRPEAGPAERARQASAYLRRKGSYTLDLTHLDDGPQAIRGFLENGMKGHCELFATSLALILREQGIPSRLITGFSVPGQPDDPPGSDLVVGHRHAHAWVEAYLPESGWTVFDPTPPLPLTTAPKMTEMGVASFLLAQVQNLASLVEDYDRHDQKRLWKEVKGGVVGAIEEWEHGALPRAWTRMRQNLREPFILQLAGFLVFLNLAAIWAYYRYWPFEGRRGAHRRLRRGSQASFAGLYGEILDTLRVDGTEGVACFTPTETIQRAAPRRGISEESARRLAVLYTSWRYRDRDAGIEKRIRLLLKEIRREKRGI